MRFIGEKGKFQYSLIYVIMNNINTMSSGNYYYDIFYFNTDIWWQCNEDTLTGLLYNVGRVSIIFLNMKNCDK